MYQSLQDLLLHHLPLVDLCVLQIRRHHLMQMSPATYCWPKLSVPTTPACLPSYGRGEGGPASRWWRRGWGRSRGSGCCRYTLENIAERDSIRTPQLLPLLLGLGNKKVSGDFLLPPTGLLCACNAWPLPGGGPHQRNLRPSGHVSPQQFFISPPPIIASAFIVLNTRPPGGAEVEKEKEGQYSKRLLVRSL